MRKGHHMGVAVVTGASGALGREVVENFLREGTAVVALDAVLPAKPFDGDVEARALDLTDADAVAEAIVSALGDRQVSAVANCVGISPKEPDGGKISARDITVEGWRRVLDVNALAPLLVIQQCWDRFAPGASIVNVASLAGKTGSGNWDGSRLGITSPAAAHYSASKAALINLTLSMARELGPRGVRCNAVSPGTMGRGGMAASMGTDEAVARFEAGVARIIDELPLGRVADYREVASVIHFLAGPSASYITGEVIDVNGGWFCD